MKHCFCVLIIIYSTKIFSQIYSVNTFCESIGGSGNEYSKQVIETSDSGYVIAGSTNMFDVLHPDIYVVKTDANGHKQWATVISTTGEDIGNSILQANDSTLIMCGSVFNSGAYNCAVARLNMNGEVLEFTSFGDLMNNEIYKAIKTSDNGIACVGYSDTLITNDLGDSKIIFHPMLIKLNESLEIEWVKQFAFNDSSAGVAHDIIQQPDSDFIITGEIEIQNADGLFFTPDMFVAKISGDGELIWFKKIGNEENVEVGNCITPAIDNGFISAGYEYSDSAGTNMYFVKLNDSGNVEWQKTIDNGGYEEVKSMFISEENNYMIGGVAENELLDYYLLKTDDSLNIIWSTVAGNTEYDFASSLIQTRDTNFIMTGYRKLPGGFSYDIYLVKSDSAGNSCCKSGSGGNVEMIDAPSYSGGVIYPLSYTGIPGIEYSSGGTFSYLCADSVSNNDTTEGIINTTDLNDLINIYPNPVNNILNVFIKNATAENSNISIYNISGELILNEFIASLSISFTKQFELSKYADGMYEIKVDYGDIVIVRKFVLMKR